MAFNEKQNSKKKKRILIVSTAYFPLIGGAEIAVKEITDRLGDGYEFDLITIRHKRNLPKKELINGVSVYRVGGLVYFFPFWVMLKALFGTYDLIWSIMASYGAFSIPFIKILKPKTKFLLTLQEGDHENHILERVGIFRPFYIWIFRSADYVQAISNYLADFAKIHGATCPIEVVPNGVSLDIYKNIKEQQVMSNKEQGIKIITTSRLVYKNGIDTLIRAVAQLKTSNLKLKTIIVGDGPDRSKLEDLAKELNVEEEIEFFGHIEPEKIPLYLSKSDIFVRASRSEGLGNSFLEAMAAGVPVIGTNVGGIPDFLKDPSDSSGQVPTGLFAKVDDPKDLADKIGKLITDKELREKIIKNGKELVFNNYSWDKITSDMGGIFNRIIK